MVLDSNNNNNCNPSPQPLVQGRTSPTTDQQQQVLEQIFHMDQPQPQVMVLEGWSPGPLPYLIQFLKRHGHFSNHIVQPSLPMPPFAGYWWWDIKVGLLMAIFVGGTWLFHYGVSRITASNDFLLGLWIVAQIAFTIFWCRVLTAVVVASSIAKGVEICRRELKNKNKNIRLVLAFSWGGAVAAELLLAQQQQQQDDDDDDDVAFLLMAPTTAVVAKLAYQEDVALRLSPSRQHYLSKVLHVVHARHDRVFCPHATRWRQALPDPERQFTVVNDNHLFQHHVSTTLCDILMHVVVQQQQQQQDASRNYRKLLSP